MGTLAPFLWRKNLSFHLKKNISLKHIVDTFNTVLNFILVSVKFHITTYFTEVFFERTYIIHIDGSNDFSFEQLQCLSFNKIYVSDANQGKPS